MKLQKLTMLGIGFLIGVIYCFIVLQTDILDELNPFQSKKWGTKEDIAEYNKRLRIHENSLNETVKARLKTGKYIMYADANNTKGVFTIVGIDTLNDEAYRREWGFDVCEKYYKDSVENWLDIYYRILPENGKDTIIINQFDMFVASQGVPYMNAEINDKFRVVRWSDGEVIIERIE